MAISIDKPIKAKVQGKPINAISIKVREKDNILVIPKEVVISDQRGRRVFVVS